MLSVSQRRNALVFARLDDVESIVIWIRIDADNLRAWPKEPRRIYSLEIGIVALSIIFCGSGILCSFGDDAVQHQHDTEAVADDPALILLVIERGADDVLAVREYVAGLRERQKTVVKVECEQIRICEMRRLSVAVMEPARTPREALDCKCDRIERIRAKRLKTFRVEVFLYADVFPIRMSTDKKRHAQLPRRF